MKRAKMFQFGVTNLRRLRNVRPVDIKPITLLVGRNSSGKSSFLRTFPLLRQSLQTRTSGPILWYGDFVDFGSFDGVVSDNDASQTIMFSFGVDRVNSRRGRAYPHFYPMNHIPFHDVNLTVAIRASAGKTYLSSFELKYGRDRDAFSVDLDDEGRLISIKLNGETITQHFDGYDLAAHLGSIFPFINVVPQTEDSELALYGYQKDPLVGATAKAIKPYLDRRTGQEQVERLAAEFLSISRFDDRSLGLIEERPGQKTFRKLIQDVRTKNTKKLKSKLQELYISSLFIPLAQSTFDTLREQMSQTLYIGPVRARSERYYRYQELAVSEIDPDGKNFPMFLNSLSGRQLSDFSQWVHDMFGYGVELSQPAGHISINLVVGENKTNIVDNGYGISQVLPVLGQIWWAANRPLMRGAGGAVGAPIIAIEQPELHLHPAHQALLADAFVAHQRRSTGAGGTNRALQFIIETHSEALINRMGALISDKQIAAEDVQVLIFEGETSERTTEVKVASFDSDGALQNWPYGFFQPEVS